MMRGRKLQVVKCVLCGLEILYMRHVSDVTKCWDCEMNNRKKK